MKHLLLACLLAITSASIYANEKGNGGSGDEISKVVTEENLQDIVSKIIKFFNKYPEAKKKFPEIDFEKLNGLDKKVRIEVLNSELIDKNGVTRTCLNFPDSGLIQCDSTKLQKLMNDVPELYVLIFHELLGLLGVEESVPGKPLIISYEVSSRLRAHVTKVSTYDLVYNNDNSGPRFSSNYNPSNNTISPVKGCLVREILIFGDQQEASDITEEVYLKLKKKGYIFNSKIETSSEGYKFYVDREARLGLSVHLGTVINVIDGGKFSAITPLSISNIRFFEVYEDVVLENGRIQSFSLKQNIQKPFLRVGNYSLNSAVEWALKQIPDCRN